MIEFIQNPTFKDILALVGGLTLIFTFVEMLFRIIPQFGKLRTKFWKFLASKWKHKRLEKRAIAGEIKIP